MRKALRCPSVRTRRALARATLVLGLLLAGCVRPYDGYYIPSYSSPSEPSKKEEERKEYSKKKSHYNHHGWREASPSVYRGHPSGGHPHGGRNHGDKGWRNR